MATTLFYCQRQGPCTHVYNNSKSLTIHRNTCKDSNEKDDGMDVALAAYRARKAAARISVAERATTIAEVPNIRLQTPEPVPHEPLFVNPPPEIPPQEPSPLPEQPASRGAQAKQPTWKILQQLPEAPVPLPDKPMDELPQAPQASIIAENIIQWPIHTSPNNFGPFREYPSLPSHNPDTNLALGDISDIPSPKPPNQIMTGETQLSPLAAPLEALQAVTAINDILYGLFENFITWGFMNWIWTGSAKKSISKGMKLLEYLKSLLFKLADLIAFDLKAETY
ncbi:hypothetical protein MIND_00543900 [Mycena indigotica]|uniref:Uncharacterized protein n=1 Tax=Mycena indigotica TaxID=2126181 RepID=A0A8H6WCL4_9AGAR|nr:uncharacterized protein MIND_00543900 [Mycena indigotica]KAF7307494.1 hypothetical protein MIND_00543900 [Mycena indigotica]